MTKSLLPNHSLIPSHAVSRHIGTSIPSADNDTSNSSPHLTECKIAPPNSQPSPNSNSLRLPSHRNDDKINGFPLPKIAVFNVRSLKKVNSTNRKATDLLAKDLHALNIDVLIVTETFLHKRIPDSFITIDGFTVFRRDRDICFCRQANCPRQHRGGGILIFLRASFIGEIYEVSRTSESFWLKVQHPSFQSCIFLNASYHPPSADGLPLLSYLISSVSDLRNLHSFSPIFLGGDFNHLNLSQLELNACLSILDSAPTRNEATLDLILTSRPDQVRKVDTFTPSVASDHKALILTPVTKLPAIRRKASFIDYSFKSRYAFNSLLTFTDFSEIFTSNCPHEASEIFDQKINDCMQRSFPVRTVTISDRDPPWITAKTRWLLKKKRLTSDPSVAQNISKKILRQKISFLKKADPKVLWKNIDFLTHRKAEQKSLSQSNLEPNEINRQLALRSCDNENNKIDSNPPVFQPNTNNPPSITLAETVKVIQTCRNTSPGPDNIPAFVFKDFWDILAPILHHIWNLSLKYGTFPSCYKRANILCILKSRDVKNIGDLRGISITPIIARLFEKVVHKKFILPQIVHLGDPLQFAYRPNLSTIDCLLSIQDEILSLLDQRQTDGVHCLLIDYSKAFDKINQTKAALTFPNFIDSDNICQWLYNFMKNRQQRLLWNGKHLPYLEIERGCSQGTVGGPNIFSMYTDDTRAQHPSSKLFKYSDDSTLTVPCHLPRHPPNTFVLQKEIDHIHSRAVDKQLTINADKTKHIRFCLNHHPICNCTYNTISPPIKSVTILGITFQENCLFSQHCKALIAKLKSTLYIIRDLKIHCIQPYITDKMFQALIISRIRYGLSVYGVDTASLSKIDRFLDSCHRHGYCTQPYNIYTLLQEEDKRLTNNILKNHRHPLYPRLCPEHSPSKTRNKTTRLKQKTNTSIFSKSFCNRVLPL